jgi:hypothetical protein
MAWNGQWKSKRTGKLTPPDFNIVYIYFGTGASPFPEPPEVTEGGIIEERPSDVVDN